MSARTVTEEEPRSGTVRRESRRWPALAWWLLVGVGVVHVILQIALVPLHRRPSWDEAIYLSQVAPQARALWFLPWRARGITLLIAPVLQLGGSLFALRVFLVLFSSAAVVVAFGVWIRILGVGAALAGALFAGGWLAVGSASEVKPNFMAAVLAVAATGFLVRGLTDARRSALVGAAVSVALLALFRPAEAAMLTGATWLYVLSLRRADRRILIPLTLGFAAGWLPWLIEMSIRFGGPIEALRLSSAAAQTGKGSILRNGAFYLAATAGRGDGVPVLGVAWWSAIGVLWLLALVRAGSKTERTAVGLPSFVAGAYLFEYFAWIGVWQDRYLLPTYAVLAVLTAMGIMSLVRGGTFAKALAAVGLALMIPWGVWQASVLRSVEELMRPRDKLLAVAERVAALAQDRPCTLMSTNSAPVVAYIAGCTVPEFPDRLQHLGDGGAPFAQGALRHGGPSASEVRALTNGGGLAFVVVGGRVGPLLRSVTPAAELTAGHRTWRIYQFGGPEPPS